MFAPRTIPLPPTATAHRYVFLAPMPAPHPDRLCIFIAFECGKAEWQWYRIEEWPSIQLSTRRFQLVKENDADCKYIVQVGVVDWCTCTAGTKGRRRECKHQFACRAIYDCVPAAN